MLRIFLWYLLLLISTMLIVRSLVVSPKEYQRGFLDGYQSRINYERGK